MHRNVILLLLLAAIITPTPPARAETATDPVLASSAGLVASRTNGQMSSYRTEVVLDAEARTLTGETRVKYLNTTGETQRAVPFRAYPNADYYGEGNLSIEHASVDGQRQPVMFDETRTVLSVPLRGPLAPGESATIELAFTTVVPVDSTGTYGVFSLDSESSRWALADWYPILAGWEPGTGWRLDRPTDAGDPTFSETATYDLTLTMPRDLQVAATGVESRVRTSGETAVWAIETGPVREFAMVIDDDFVTTSVETNGTRVSMITNDDPAVVAGAEIALEAAASALEVYAGWFGAYPYTELDLVDTELGGALGVSWTGLVFLNGQRMLTNSSDLPNGGERLRFTVTHEVGHQWWGAVVGVNSNDHVFLLEGLTNYLSIAVTEQTRGIATGREQLRLQCVEPYLRLLEGGGDAVADLPIDSAGGGPSGAIVYGKSALGFLAIRQAIGDDAFFGAIAAWADDFSFRIAEPADLLAAFERASGEDVRKLWRFWFEAAETTVRDVDAILQHESDRSAHATNH